MSILQINGAAPSGTIELHPGDVVTFRMSYDLVTGDYENFSLTAYLPLPLFDTTGAWSNGSGIGQWQYGAGDTHPGSLVSVTAGPGNSLVFDFGSFVMRANPAGQNRIEVTFTMRVSDQPFADQRPITVLGQSQQTTTIGQQPLISTDPAIVQSVAEPVLTIRHGVVSSSGGTVTGTTGSWSAAGSGGAAFTQPLTDINAVEGSLDNFDAGDVVRLATAIENTGGGGAFDVTTTVTLPGGLAFLNGSLSAANLRISRGDGTLLVAGVDYSVSGNTITFLDAGGQATFLAGRAGSAADTTGANVVVITYDTVAQQSVLASQNLRSVGAVTRYASVDNGSNFTPAPLTDNADARVAAPVVTKTFADGATVPAESASSASHTTGSNLVIGESMVYDIIVTLPEGGTQNLRLTDIVPPGMTLDTTYGNGGYLLITTRAGSGALGADFAGTVTVASVAASGGTAGADGTDLQLVFSASSALGDNIAGNNSFVIRVRMVASNVIGNQAGQTLPNSASLTYSDPDGDVPNGSTVLDRGVALTGSRPTVTVVEPTLSVVQSVTNTGNISGVDRGDELTYTITISNGTGSGDFNAYDVQVNDVLPVELDGVQIVGVTLSGGATITGAGDFVIVDGVLRNADGTKLDIPRGGAVVLQVHGTLGVRTGLSGSVDNDVQVRWTSLDGANAGERTGADGVLNSGALNDYRVDNLNIVRVGAGSTISHVGGFVDTPLGPTVVDQEDVAVGEIIHYRVAFLVPEGSVADTMVQVYLPDGLTFINDGSALLSFIADQNANGTPGLVTLSSGLVVGGQLYLSGGVNNASETLLRADLSGPLRAEGVLDPTRIDQSNPRVITLRLGSLVNSNNDADFEGFFFEFNVRVDNSAAVTAGTLLPVRAEFLSGTELRNGTDTVVERVVEPRIADLDKAVVAFDPGVGTAFGQATYQVSFSNTGTSAAYDVLLSDTLPAGGQGLAVQSVTIDGTAYAPNALPAGFTLTTSGDSVQLSIGFLPAGHVIGLVYTANLPNGTFLTDTSATVTYTSLASSFTGFGGSTVGAPGSVTGERTGSLLGPNTYLDGDAAGVSYLSGSLWNDTDSATSSVLPDGPGIAGQLVTLTWGGADNNLSTTADNRTWTTTTDASGFYSFGVLGRGVFRIDAPPTIALAAPTGTVNARIDNDAATPLARVDFSGGDLGASVAGSVGYVERNDPPVNQLPGAAQSLDEDTTLNIIGLSVSDPDAGTGAIRVTLTVGHGTLTLTPGTALVVAGALGTATLTLQGSQQDINAALATLVYAPSQDYNGTETLVIRTDDLGQRGDVDGDGIPFEPVDDNLTDIDSLAITVIPVNDAPIAVADVATAKEAGGTDNLSPGVDPAGNVITNDIDVDIATNQDVLTVTTVVFGGSSQNVPSGAGGATIAGLYGELQIGANGAYHYVVNNSNATVQALRLSGDTLTEVFSYTIADLAGITSTATLTVTITGANDAPVAADDVASATEAGGAANGTPGSDGGGNVLTNDTDVDAGDSRTVTHVRAGDETNTGTPTLVPVGSSAISGGVSLAGLYGTLTIGADGSYVYQIDNSNAQVQALNVGDTLTEVFSYAVTDVGGLRDVAQLHITINGANDNPVAVDNTADAYTARVDVGTGTVTGTPVNPVGNVILDERTTTSTDEIDSDVDNPVASDVVSLIRPDGAGTDTAVTVGGVSVTGTYGQLEIRADGTYRYLVDSTNPVLIALSGNQTVQEAFVYTLRDPQGGTSTAQLIVTIHGLNDQPVANDVTAIAVEAGGVGNSTGGAPATGDATANDIDPDGDVISVINVTFGSTSLAVPAGGSVTIPGLYGSLTINDTGVFTYTVNDSLDAVQALRRSTDTLTETFTYTDSDGTLTSSARIIIRIRGNNDNPVANDDVAEAREAGGRNNATPGANPIGNVLDNDTDVDRFGETRTVTGARVGVESAGAVNNSGTSSMLVAGLYGTLQLNADGSFSYIVDNNNAAVEALNVGQSLTETFTYKVADALGLTDLAQLTITIRGANDAPIAASQRNDATEAGGTANATPGVDPTGDLTLGVVDVDANDTDAVSAFRTGGLNDNGGTVGVFGQALVGRYGSLIVRADGTYQYVVDNTNPAVERLRTATDTLVDVFTFTLTDAGGLSDSAELRITIHGANDAPVARPDTGTAIEAGGTANATPGAPAAGNVLTNDTDIDAADTKVVGAIQTSGGTTGTVGSALAGLYGSLIVGTNGGYVYVVDDSLAAVQALKPGESLSESFVYTVRDAGGLTHTSTLTITILGRYDAPVAIDDVTDATPATSVTAPIDAVGNVLGNDTDVDANDSKTLTGIRAGAELAGGDLQDVAGTVRINGRYGWLEVSADGSFRYHADETIDVVAALAPGETLQERFTYRVTDGGGLIDLAQLTVTIHGVNDLPVASDVLTVAIEAGGVANGTLGRNPSGSATFNDVDPEGGALTVVGVRTGPESGSGTTGAVGVALRGRYGTLVINADGRFSYIVDNTLPEVEALRGADQTLLDSFTYTVSDNLGATDQATLRVLILGQNDNPVAQADIGGAVEAGGHLNTTPGSDAVGNVLANDTDVDANESKTITTISGDVGAGAVGGATVGRYGTLTLQADGSYRYVVDNDNPVVQAMRTSGESLTEIFTYVVSDHAGATATATLTITINGQNDAPVARDDVGHVDDQHGDPVTTGNVLPNDSDVDANDALTVVGVRAGTEAQGGASVAPGTRIAGSYGFLVLNADGSYRYEIDMTNPAVQAAAGRGDLLQDIFTYTIADRAGATDQAQLVITLNIDAPYVPPPSPTPPRYTGDYHYDIENDSPESERYTGLRVTPVVYVTPAVRESIRLTEAGDYGLSGERPNMVKPPEIDLISLAAGLGQDNTVRLRPTLQQLESIAELERLRMAGRHGVVSLSADGWLSDPSVFEIKGIQAPAATPRAAPARQGDKPRAAAGFSEQVRRLAARATLTPDDNPEQEPR